MSIDAILAEFKTLLQEQNTTTLALIAALKVTGENQERLIAGQSAAIEKVDAPKRTRRTKEELAADAAAEAATKTPAAETPKTETVKVDTTPDVRTVSDDDLRNVASTYLAGDASVPATQTKDAIDARKDFIRSIMKELGTPMITGPKSTLDDDGRLRAAFYVQRKAEGLPVDFSADYDFQGEPTQGDGAPEVEADDDFGLA